MGVGCGSIVDFWCAIVRIDTRGPGKPGLGMLNDCGEPWDFIPERIDGGQGWF